MEIWLKGSSKVRLPVLPASYTVQNPQDNQSVDVIGLGKVTLTGKRGLTSVSFSSFFPRRYDPSYCQYADIDDPEDYVNKIEKMKRNGPVKLVITGTTIHSYFLINDFEWGESDGSGNINYSLSFSEYRAPSVTKSEVVKEDTTAQASEQATEESRAEQPAVAGTTYTVKSGDTLSGIARKLTGSANWQTIYELNKTTIGGNPNLIYPGQTLFIPS